MVTERRRYREEEEFAEPYRSVEELPSCRGAQRSRRGLEELRAESLRNREREVAQVRP